MGKTESEQHGQGARIAECSVGVDNGEAYAVGGAELDEAQEWRPDLRSETMWQPHRLIMAR